MAEPKTEAYQGKEFPLFPKITVKLSGTDGNVFAIMGAGPKGSPLRQGLARKRLMLSWRSPRPAIMDHTIQTAMRTVAVT